MSDMEKTVARLRAVEEIKVLKARYAEVSDTGYDGDRAIALFAPGAVWDGGEKFGRHEGLDAIRDLFNGFGGQISWALHYMIAPLIEVADDLEGATGSWYLWQPCTLVTPDGERATWIAGKYHDTYVLHEEEWKIAAVSLDCQAVSPYDEGWVAQRFIDG